MMFKQVMAFLLVIFFTKQVSAGDYDINLCSVQINDNGNAYIRPCQDWVSKNGCNNGTWITWNASTDSGKAMYSTSLTAFTTGSNVLVRMNGSACNHYDVTNIIRVTK